MSQYTSIFIRDKGKFLEIGCWSRSHYIAQALNTVAPYEHVAPLTKDKIKTAMEYLDNRKAVYLSMIEKHKWMLEQMKDFKCDDIVERAEMLDEYFCFIKENEQEVEEIVRAIHYLEVYADIATDSYYLDSGDYYVYVGIEICDPGVNDIINEGDED